VKFVLHDPDASFTAAFDAIFQAASARVLHTAEPGGEIPPGHPAGLQQIVTDQAQTELNQLNESIEDIDSQFVVKLGFLGSSVNPLKPPRRAARPYRGISVGRRNLRTQGPLSCPAPQISALVTAFQCIYRTPMEPAILQVPRVARIAGANSLRGGAKWRRWTWLRSTMTLSSSTLVRRTSCISDGVSDGGISAPVTPEKGSTLYGNIHN
jgi:hypothetical protein